MLMCQIEIIKDKPNVNEIFFKNTITVVKADNEHERSFVYRFLFIKTIK